MIEKIVAFFKSKTVRTVCIVLFVVSVAGLIVGGLTTQALSGLIVAVAAIVAAIAALIAYIGKL